MENFHAIILLFMEFVFYGQYALRIMSTIIILHAIASLSATWSTEEGESPDNTRTYLIVLCFCVTVASELGSLSKQASTKPRSMSLSLVCYYLHFQPTTPCSSTSRLRSLDACIHQMSDISLQPAAEIFV